MDADLALAQVFEIQLDLSNGPRGFEAEDSLVKAFVSHNRNNTGNASRRLPGQGLPPSPSVPFGATGALQRVPPGGAHKTVKTLLKQRVAVGLGLEASAAVDSSCSCEI